jgi:Tfp pilus assembly protein PilN
MDAVSRALPDLLWLDNMRVDGNTIQMSGRAFNVSAISNFVENLGRVPEFDEPQGVTADEAGRVYRFSLRVGYSLSPPPGSIGEGEDGGLAGDEATDAGAAGG